MASPVKDSITDTERPGYVAFHIRGRFFEIEEIEAAQYEAHARAAVVDEDEGTVDMGILTKLVTLDAVKVDGQPIDADAWGKEKFPVVNRVQTEVRRLHYIELETDEEAAERKAAEKAAEDADKPKKKGPDRPNS